MEEALHDLPVLRRFAGQDAGSSRMPDETTILNFRHLLQAHPLAESLFQEVVSLLAERGLILREGTIVDATLIAAPPSTKNEARKRDPEMTSSKKGYDTTPEEKRLTRLLAALRLAVERPFRVPKRQFGHTKVWYRGLFKSEPHLFSQFVRVDLYLARHLIVPAG